MKEIRAHGQPADFNIFFVFFVFNEPWLKHGVFTAGIMDVLPMLLVCLGGCFAHAVHTCTMVSFTFVVHCAYQCMGVPASVRVFVAIRCAHAEAAWCGRAQLEHAITFRGQVTYSRCVTSGSMSHWVFV